MSEPPQQRDADDAADGGWSWGPLEGGTPGYGAAPGGPPQGPPQSGAPQPQYGAPQPQYGAPQYGAPPQGPPQLGSPQYGAPQYGAPQYGPQYGTPPHGAPPQYGAPQYGPQYGAPQYGAPAGYAPMPVQRGIVPLRPLSLGEIYDGAFRSIRANPRVMFGFSMLVVGVAAAVGGLVWYLLVPTLSRWVETTLGSEAAYTQETGDFLASVYAMYTLLPFLALAGIALSGILTVSVSRSVIGQQIGVGELWRGYWKRTLVVVGYTILLSLVVVAAWVLIVLLIAAAAALSEGLGVFVGVVATIGGIVAAVWVGYRLLLVPPVLMLEGGRFLPSVQRAWRLTRGSFWRLLGINLLAQIIANIVSQVISVPVSIVAALVLVSGEASGLYIVLMTLGMAVAYTIPAIFLAAVVALQYVDLRIRREGLDVQLARAAEANATRAA